MVRGLMPRISFLLSSGNSSTDRTVTVISSEILLGAKSFANWAEGSSGLLIDIGVITNAVLDVVSFLALFSAGSALQYV